MRLWQIEITNKCNFTCDYCPRTELMLRSLGVMSKETIDRIAVICTSNQLHLHHFGETLLEMPTALYAVKVFTRTGISTVINTNGSACTLRNVNDLFDAGLTKMVISWHPMANRVGGSARNSLSGKDKEATSFRHLLPLARELPKDRLSRLELIRVVDEAEEERARYEMDIYREVGIPCSIKRKRNLGQYAGPNETAKPPAHCSFLDKPEFAVLWNGSIVSCCEVYDDRPEWVLGSVHSQEDVDRLSKNNPGCGLCCGCLGYGGEDEETEKTAI